MCTASNHASWVAVGPARLISTIEALAVLLGLKLFHGDDVRSAPARNPDDTVVN